MSLIALLEPSFISAEQQVKEGFTRSAGTGTIGETAVSTHQCHCQVLHCTCVRRELGRETRRTIICPFELRHVQVYFPILDERVTSVKLVRAELGNKTMISILVVKSAARASIHVARGRPSSRRISIKHEGRQ